MKKDNYKYLFLFIFFTLILFLSPRSGDDWGNFLEGSLGIRHMIGNAIGMYFDWEGRFVSRLLINFLTFYKPIWNILNSLMIVGIIYFVNKITNPKNRKDIFYLTILIILAMNIYTFSQVVVWIAGNITYLFVIFLLLYYFNTLINQKYSNKKYNVLLLILNFIIPMFVEHTGIVLVIGNLLILFYEYYKTHRINKKLLFYLMVSIIGLLLMLLSPGTYQRSQIENIEFKELSIFQKIWYNIPNFIYYTYYINFYMIVLMTVGNYYLTKEIIKNRIFKVIGCLYLTLFPIFITINYLTSNFLNLTILQSFNQYNNFVILYFISYSIVEFILIAIYTKKTKDLKIFFFFLLGMLANLAMLISPTWGSRTSFATYIFLCISYLIIIEKQLKSLNLINNFLFSIIICGFSFYSILYISIARQSYENVKSIEEQKKLRKDVIEIKKFPYFANCNINPENSYHLDKFKKYYGIDSNVKIKLIDNNWKFLIFYNE